jgi:glucan phosphoethanolaminetransferase (alkaline phosphatase superfamily)
VIMASRWTTSVKFQPIQVCKIVIFRKFCIFVKLYGRSILIFCLFVKLSLCISILVAEYYIYAMRFYRFVKFMGYQLPDNFILL